jgi:hypothetical protein
MARVPREAAIPGKFMPGSIPPRTVGRQLMPGNMSTPASEPAYKTSPGASVNKRSVPREPAFKTRPGPGSDV